MRFRITVILMIALGGLTAIGAGGVLLISATASIRNTLELMRERAELTVAAVDRGVAAHIAPARNLITDLSGRVARSELNLSDGERLVEILSGALAPVPQIDGVAVWRPNGDGTWVTRRPGGGIAVATGRGQDHPEFAPFIADVGSGGLHWGAPYYKDGATSVTLAAAVERNGVYGGTIATGVSVVELSRYVRNLAEQGMTAFVIYGNDRVLAHPAMLDARYSRGLSEDRPLLSIAEIDDPVLAQFASLPTAELPNETGFELREAEVGDVEHIILSRVSGEYGSVPWNIGVHVPVEAIAQQFERLAASTLLSVGLFVVAVVAALFLARRVARPVRAASAAAAHIERLDLDSVEPLPRSRIRELDEQARSFNSMVEALRWFRTYVPHQLVHRLMHASSGDLGAVRAAELTVMFTDIKGFTPLSEAMPPVEVAAMLNRHFELLNACIAAEDGTLDKFIGDATLAFWGAPEPVPDHAARACRAALAMAGAMDERTAAGETPRLQVKIAIHTGPLIVGNIGAEARMNYTVIGDTVNVCARIEDLSSEFTADRPVTILVSGDVVEAAGPGFRFEPIGDRFVKGRARSVEVWRLVG